ncbi:hypothetical protein [Pseudomonas aeruginosa]|uniref:hypothetical protein n=1 Tax=Pseudomonas aeruginosa TaxID=287 RepID=UPI000EAC925D|nr:hypothetical protein [Pseudomonas aeruginosa]
MKNVRIKEGAEAHLRSKRYWLNAWDDLQVDGPSGTVVQNYLDITEYPHYEVELSELGINIGISPDWLEEISP